MLISGFNLFIKYGTEYQNKIMSLSMSWIEKIWGNNKESQFKGFLSLIAALLLGFIVIFLIILRQFDLGEEWLISTLIYLFILSVTSAILSLKQYYRLSLIVLMALTIDLAIGYGPLVVHKLGFKSVIHPSLPVGYKSQFEFHPTLAAVPTKKYHTNTITHSEHGIRNNGSVFDPEKPHIAVFGGSTTYDIGVSNDAATWVSRLNDLNPQYTFSNNGVPGYSSSEHVIQTAFYEERAGSVPVCSLYYVGWNDIRNFGFDRLDNGYADFHLLSQYGNLTVRFTANTPSPTLNILTSYIFRRELPFPQKKGSRGKDIKSDDDLFRVFGRNMRVIDSINRMRGIKTVFIGQVLNRERLLSKDRAYGWLPNVYDFDVWPLQNRFNLFTEELSRKLGVGYIHPDINLFHDDDFADNGHFSDKGARIFGQLVSNELIDKCALS